MYAARTAQWISDHPTLRPVLDRLDLFAVSASSWFAVRSNPMVN
jgi:hypothetical protein